MRAKTIAAIILVAGEALGTMPAAAQLTGDDVARPGTRSDKVEKALQLQRLDTEITYLKPGAKFEPGAQLPVTEPPKEKSREERRRDFNLMRWQNGLIFGAVVLAIVILVVLFGGRIQVSFRDTEDRRRGGKDGDGSERLAGLDDVPEDAGLAYFLGIADRREALIKMTGQALERAAAANGVRLARAHTARDVLGVLPGTWRHMQNIRQLVRHAEIVHFGGRDLAEETWRACVELARPVFGAGRLT